MKIERRDLKEVEEEEGKRYEEKKRINNQHLGTLRWTLDNEGECGRVGCNLQMVLKSYCRILAGHKAVRSLLDFRDSGTRPRDSRCIHRYLCSAVQIFALRSTRVSMFCQLTTLTALTFVIDLMSHFHPKHLVIQDLIVRGPGP